MAPKEIDFKITKDQADDEFSIEEWYGFQNAIELYEKMLKFCVDEAGKPVDEADARKFFKGRKKKEFAAYRDKFMKAVTDALINPTSGGN